jgi:hypothetical protein
MEKIGENEFIERPRSMSLSKVNSTNVPLELQAGIILMLLLNLT